MAAAEFAINNKTHLATKVSLFIVNYGRESMIEVDIRKNGKIKKTTEFMKRVKKIQKEVGVALRKA